MDDPKAKKSLGQHWLHDDVSLDAMGDAVDLSPQDNVLEIGPGLGTLTAKLLQAGANVTAIELDHALATKLTQRTEKLLQQKTSEHKNRPWERPLDLQVVEGDILKFDLGGLPAGYKVVANIPYYLTGKLLRIMCEAPNHFSKAALLLQKEVAQKVCAEPGDMSMLSVSVQYYCQAKLGALVPAHLFTPPPKVDSQILQLDYRSQPLFDDVDTKQFFRLVKAGFAQRRKILLNTLSSGLHLQRNQAADVLKSADIDPQTRAQALSLQDWRQLYNAFYVDYKLS